MNGDSGSASKGHPVPRVSKDFLAALFLFLLIIGFFFPVLFQGKTFFFRDIFRANRFYRAVQLKEGTHTIEFLYEPEGFRMGIVMAASVLILLLTSIPIPAISRRIFNR